jgi:predicted DNA-binding protein (UPF0251 family)
VKVSEKALQSARDKLADCVTESPSLPNISDTRTDMGSNGLGFGGFMTARGSKVKVSEKALQLARDKLADCVTESPSLPNISDTRTDISSGGSGFGGFMTARGSKVKVSEKALQSARDKLADCVTGESSLPNMSETPTKNSEDGAGFGGFMTARGSKVKVFEASLQEARDKLADINTVEPALNKFCIVEGLKMTEDEPKTRDLCTLNETSSSMIRSNPPEVPKPRKPIFVGGIRNDQIAKFTSADATTYCRKPSKLLMQVPKLRSNHQPAAVTEFPGGVPATDVLNGSRDAVKSTPDGKILLVLLLHCFM